MNDESTVLQFEKIFSLHGTRHFSAFVAGMRGVAEFPCAIIWDAALVMLSESQGSSSQIGALMANFPEKLAELRSSTLLILLGVSEEPETRDSWLVSVLFRVFFRALIRESSIEHSFV
jgi:hypothetical protein